MFDWELHLEAAKAGVLPVGIFLVGSIGYLALLVLAIMHPWPGFIVLFMTVFAGLHWHEYRKASRRRKLRDDTGGTCG